MKFRGVKANGELSYLNARGTVYKDDNGKPIKILGIVWDVTEEEEVKQKLLSTSRFKKAILDSTEYLVISGDDRGLIRTFNKAAEKLLGYTAEEMVNKQGPGIFHDEEEVVEYAKELNEEYGWNLEPGFEVFIAKAKYLGEVDSREWTYITKSGSRIPVNLSVTPIRDCEENIIGYLGVAKDITVEKQKQVELERSNTELEHFAYITSHDLKEPLRVIASYSQLIEKKIAKYNIEDDSINLYVDYMTASVRRMLDMINAILAYSRVGRKATYDECSLQEIVDNVLDDLSQKILDQNAQISVPELPCLSVCEHEVRQLFQNLISNALKFIEADKQARVTITAKALSENTWQFSVEDNGIGIAADSYERIFVLFQRLHTREEFDGTGIGLAMCKKIVENHNGKIWLESNLGEGTKFFFTLSNMS